MEGSKINILSSFENPYFNRTEYYIEVNLEKSKFPSRAEFRALLSKQLDIPEELLVIKWIRSEFGGIKCYAEVFAYKDKESLKIEPTHILLKHLNKEERAKRIEEMKKKKLEAKKAKEVSKK